jgi:hypothetical protein
MEIGGEGPAVKGPQSNALFRSANLWRKGRAQKKTKFQRNVRGRIRLRRLRSPVSLKGRSQTLRACLSNSKSDS